MATKFGAVVGLGFFSEPEMVERKGNHGVAKCNVFGILYL